jgi:hypothetical protein
VRRGALGGRLAVCGRWGDADRLGLGGRLCRVVAGAEGRCDPAARVLRGVRGPSAGVVGDTERREPGEVHCGSQQ